MNDREGKGSNKEYKKAIRRKKGKIRDDKEYNGKIRRIEDHKEYKVKIWRIGK